MLLLQAVPGCKGARSVSCTFICMILVSRQSNESSRLTDAKLFTMPFGCANACIYAWLRGNLICLRFISARQAG